MSHESSNKKAYCTEDQDIMNVGAMHEILEVQKIKQLSELHNFRCEESGIRVWRAYAVGVGRLIP